MRRGQQQIMMSPRYHSHLFISIACPSPDEASSTQSTSWWRPALQPCKPWQLSWPKTMRTSPAGGASTSQRSCQRKTLITTTASKRGRFCLFKAVLWESFVADHFNNHDDSGKCAMRQCGHFSSLLPPWSCGKELLGKQAAREQCHQGFDDFPVCVLCKNSGVSSAMGCGVSTHGVCFTDPSAISLQEFVGKH